MQAIARPPARRSRGSPRSPAPTEISSPRSGAGRSSSAPPDGSLTVARRSLGGRAQWSPEQRGARPSSQSGRPDLDDIEVVVERAGLGLDDLQRQKAALDDRRADAP